MKVILSSVGNPSYGQNPDQPLYGAKTNVEVDVETFNIARLMCLEFISNNELGGGNWSGGDILDNGKLIAYVSYNGRVWKVDENGHKYTDKNEEIIINK